MNTARRAKRTAGSGPRTLFGTYRTVFSDGLAVALILGLTVAFFVPALLQGGSAVVGSPMCDALTMFYPLRAFANEELQCGRFPLWNPCVFCGHPFHAEGQAAAFYPVNLLLAFLPAAWSMNLLALLHFAGAGVFFYWYLREIGLAAFASLFGALVYCFSSGPVARFYAGHYTIIPFLALVPAALWLWERWRRRGGMGWLAGATLAFGGMILAGYPQLVLYSTRYLGLQALFAVAQGAKRAGRRGAARPAGAFAAVVVGGALLGAVQLLPSQAFARYSLRQQTTYEFCASYSFPPENFLTLLAPRFFGDLVDPDDVSGFPYWGRYYPWEMWIYLGIAPLALALMAAGRVRSREAAAHALAAPVFAALALGRHTPLFRLLYWCVPFFNYFRGSSKFTFYALISLCALAAIGADRILSPPDEKRLRGDRLSLLFILGAMLAIAAALFGWLGWSPEAAGSSWRRLVAWRFQQGETSWPDFSLDQFPPPSQSWAAAAGSLWRLIFLAGAALAVVAAWNRLQRRPEWAKAALFAVAIPELWLFSSGYLRMAPVEIGAVPQPFVAAIQADQEPGRILPMGPFPNASAIVGLETPRGYAGNITARYNNFLTAISGAPRGSPMVVTALSSSVSPQWLWPNVRYLILHWKADVPPQIGESVLRCGEEVLWRLRQPVPRAYFSTNPRIVPTAEAALQAIESGETTVQETDLIEAADASPFAGIGPPAEDDRLGFVVRRPGRVVLATAAAGPRILALSDSYEPNWQCRIDGKERATIYPLNIAFRAVLVPAGEHRVEFVYAPRSFYCGLSVTCVAFVAAIAVMLWPAICAQKKGKSRA